MGWHYQSLIFTICIFFQVQGTTLLHYDFHAVIITTFLLVIILFCWSQIVGCIFFTDSSSFVPQSVHCFAYFSNRTMIHNFKKEGKIVPSEITVKLLQQAMQQSDNNRFIIDGFPRNEENRAAFENIVKIKPEFVLFFDCPEEELTRRSLNRNQGRVDDNIETIGKRLKVYFESTLPVINYYNSKGKVQKIDAQRSVNEVFEDVKSVFAKFKPVVRALLHVVGSKDFIVIQLLICWSLYSLFKGFF
uniref:adenylate kinase n=1 Tax=Salix viminalis TaxID=40686 RepID=A0A6N2MX17_SALVM